MRKRLIGNWGGVNAISDEIYNALKKSKFVLFQLRAINEINYWRDELNEGDFGNETFGNNVNIVFSNHQDSAQRYCTITITIDLESTTNNSDVITKIFFTDCTNNNSGTYVPFNTLLESNVNVNFFSGLRVIRNMRCTEDTIHGIITPHYHIFPESNYQETDMMITGGVNTTGEITKTYGFYISIPSYGSTMMTIGLALEL